MTYLLDKAIKGLECCILRDPDDFPRCSVCPYESNCVNRLKMDVLALLKAQEPRVMTLDEIKDGEPYWLSAGKEFVPRPVICIHREDDARKPYITFAWQFGTFSWESEDYDKTWRCWTSRPTDEQREAVKWDD